MADKPLDLPLELAHRARFDVVDLRTHFKAEHQAMASATSASVGNRPACFLEKRSLPSTVISNTPPPDFRNSTGAAGVLERMMSRAARARGS